MDKDFQTSFIPKKPIIEGRIKHAQPISLLTVISLFVFLAFILFTGGLYVYKGMLTKNITQMQSDLNLSQTNLEPSKITEFKALDSRLKASTQILGGHITVSPIFQVLEDLTMKTIRYTKFSYSLAADQGSPISVKMSGTTVGYREIALQSDLFAKNKNIIDPVFSNLSLDTFGNVTFDLNFSVDPNFVNYKHVLSLENDNSTTIPGGTMN